MGSGFGVGTRVRAGVRVRARVRVRVSRACRCVEGSREACGVSPCGLFSLLSGEVVCFGVGGAVRSVSPG